MQYVVNAPHALMLFLAGMFASVICASWFNKCSREFDRVEYETSGAFMMTGIVVMVYAVVCAFIDIWVMF